MTLVQHKQRIESQPLGGALVDLHGARNQGATALRHHRLAHHTVDGDIALKGRGENNVALKRHNSVHHRKTCLLSHSPLFSPIPTIKSSIIGLPFHLAV